ETGARAIGRRAARDHAGGQDTSRVTTGTERAAGRGERIPAKLVAVRRIIRARLDLRGEAIPHKLWFLRPCGIWSCVHTHPAGRLARPCLGTRVGTRVDGMEPHQPRLARHQREDKEDERGQPHATESTQRRSHRYLLGCSFGKACSIKIKKGLESLLKGP